MRVLWLAPWFRPWANIYGRGLTLQGHSVLVVTTHRYPEPGPALVDELVGPSRIQSVLSGQFMLNALKAMKQFKPDVIIQDENADPRFDALARYGRARWLVIHDGVPHDKSHQLSWRQRIQINSARSRTPNILVFSEHVEKQVAKTTKGRIFRIPLVSGVCQDDVPILQSHDSRRDFVIAGRIRPYKNIDFVADAWARHVKGSGFQGDRLIVWGMENWGDAEKGDSLVAPHMVVRYRRYTYSEIKAGKLSSFKGSVCTYQGASQSAVQILSMQLGVPVIVTNDGALGEYQLDRELIVDSGDREGLRSLFDRLASGEEAEQRGRLARERYESTLGESVAARRLASALTRGQEATWDRDD